MWYDFSANCTGVVNAVSDNATVLQPFRTGENYVYVIDKVLIPDSLVNWTRRAAARLASAVIDGQGSPGMCMIAGAEQYLLQQARMPQTSWL